MFTGLIEEIGTVLRIVRIGSAARITVSSKLLSKNASTGDSISINGACQSVVEVMNGSFTVEAVEETIKKTNIGQLRPVDRLNLESSLTLSKKIGGHLVLGHVDGTGCILEINKLGLSHMVSLSYPGEFSKYLVNVGSIAVDGISLTIANSSERFLQLSVIPQTWESTTLKEKRKGDSLNLEFDILGKYVEKMINPGQASSMTIDRLRELGF